MYLVIPWLTHGYALHLIINTSQFLPFLPSFSLAERYFSPFLPMAGEKYLSTGEKANPDIDIWVVSVTHQQFCLANVKLDGSRLI